MNLKKSMIMLLIGAVILGMSTLTASAERDVIEHDASKGEREIEDPIIAPSSEDDSLIIAPGPDDHNVDILTDDSEDDDKAMNAGLPILGTLGIVATIAIIIFMLNRKN